MAIQNRNEPGVLAEIPKTVLKTRLQTKETRKPLNQGIFGVFERFII
jgi:hypothetical protein